MKNRRTDEGKKLRIYIDAIKDVKAITNQQWIDQWAINADSSPYISKAMWISCLERCALQEAEKFAQKVAA